MNVSEMPAPRRSTSPWVEIRQSLPSRLSAISPFVDQLMSFIYRFFPQEFVTDGAEGEIVAALRTALSDAILRGHPENAANRVSVQCRCTMDGEVRIRVCAGPEEHAKVLMMRKQLLP